MPMPRLRPRVYLPLLVLLPLFALAVYARHQWKSLPEHWRHNIVIQQTPQVLRPYVTPFIPPGNTVGPPTLHPELVNARWAGSWPIPALTPPQYRLAPLTELRSPAFLMLHIFSTPRRSSRLRRELIREYNLLQAVPKAYHHLIEIKFVFGLPQILEENEDLVKEYDEEEGHILEEQRRHGDIIRLHELAHGENMNEGKSLEWMRHVGREGGREAQWVFKCDDDTFPILPNFLAFLAQQDPAKPSYVGTSIGRWTGYHFYFEGMMYGFSWGVIKTMATADVSKDFIQTLSDEDARTGVLMYNLPPIPLCEVPHTRFNRSTQCVNEQVPFDTPPASGWDGAPDSPDPRTGLVRLDLGRRLGGWDAWAIPKTAKSVGWHYVKSDSDYAAAYYRAHQLIEAAGRAYLWAPPEDFHAFADVDIM